MFDTIRCMYQIIIPMEIFEELEKEQPNNVVINENIDRENRQTYFTAQIKHQEIHYIFYMSKTATLFFEVSIPKLVLGSNVRELTQEDIEHFYLTIKSKLYDLLQIEVNLDQVTVTKLDVCQNINIKPYGKNMQEILLHIANQKIPYRRHVSEYKFDQKKTGVVFKTHAESYERISFYDKKAEMITNYSPYSNEAENILRVEIKTSKYERKKYGSTKLTKLLTSQFYSYIMAKYDVKKYLPIDNKEVVNVGKDINKTTEQLPIQWLIDQGYKISKLEQIIGFMAIKEKYKDQAPNFYEAKTYRNKEKELKKLNELLELKSTS